jgi:chromosome segregation ATPase
MELHTIRKNYEKNLLNIDKIKQQIGVLQNQMPSLMNEFVNAYVLYKKDPEIQEYQQSYENTTSNIESINSKLFKIQTNIESNIDKVNSMNDKLNEEIKKEKILNAKFKKQLGITNDQYNSSEERIEDYVEIYNIEYLQNFSILVGIIGLGIFLSKNFSQQLQ